MLLFAFFVLIGIVTAQVDFGNWHPPAYGDVRSPCPGLNSLANHGIIPRDGRNLTPKVLIPTLMQALNISSDIATTIALGGLSTSSNPASGAFNLDDLNKHNAIEHDGSLSRKDTNLGGEGQQFSQEIFDEFLGNLNGSTQIDISLAAAARWGRIQKERGRDPKFTYGPKNRFNSYSESAIYHKLLQDPKTGNVSVDFLKIFFSEERFPFNEGWRPVNVISAFSIAADILSMAIKTPENDADLKLDGEMHVFHGGRL